MNANRPTLLSVVGMVRSGSTFFEGRVGALCGGVAVGEFVGAWGAMGSQRLRCSCGTAPVECPFWAEVARNYRGLSDEGTIAYMTAINQRIMSVRRVGSWHGILRNPTSPQLGRYRAEVRALYEAVAATAGRFGFRTVVDSSKHPLFYGIARAAMDPASFSRQWTVRLVRDPRAVAHSLMTPKEQRSVSGEVHQMKSYSWWATMPFWIAMNAFADRVVPQGTPRFRYEDFHTERYVDWIRSVGLLAPSASRGDPSSAHHQLIANPVRHLGAASFSLDDRWRRELPLSVRVASLVAYPWMARYGYLIRTGSPLSR